MSDYHDLFVWQRAMELSASVYQLTSALPKSERFNLIDQMRRAVTSIHANISEGSNRTTAAARRQYITISYGSALELESHLSQVRICRLASEQNCNEVGNILTSVLRLLNCSYKNPCKKKKNKNQHS